MAYPLFQLFKVRKHREAMAQREVQVKTLEFEQARNEEQLKHEEYELFTKERPERESAYFRIIQNKEVPQKELDSFFNAIATLRQHELALYDETILATKKREDAEGILEMAIKEFHECQKNTKKLQEHKQIWDNEARRKKEFEEEKESEDTSSFAKKKI